MIRFRLKMVFYSLCMLFITFAVSSIYMNNNLIESIANNEVIEELEDVIKVPKRLKPLRESYISGNYDNEFITLTNLTNSELACMIFEIENLEYGYDCIFEDTKDNSYVGVISAVVKKGYMDANDDNKFLPDNYLTRASFAKIVYNIMKKNKTIKPFKTVRKYNGELVDINKCDQKDYIIKLYEYGIIDGNNKNKYRPLDFLSKEEAIVIFNKIYGYDKGDFDHMLEVYNENPYVNLDSNYWAFKDIVRATVGLEK